MGTAASSQHPVFPQLSQDQHVNIGGFFLFMLSLLEVTSVDFLRQAAYFIELQVKTLCTRFTTYFMYVLSVNICGLCL